MRFDPDAPRDEERQRIKERLMDEITAIACGLPLHRVVPYLNLPKKDHPMNLPLEVYSGETKAL